MKTALKEIWLIRHGETEWSLSGAHTGRTDIPLTENGCRQAQALAPLLAKVDFSLVLSSPLSRAKKTCQLAGFEGRYTEEPDLLEWDYGIYEGKRTKDIQQTKPGWNVWSYPIPEGESLEDVSTRARRVIARCLACEGRVALFAHAHILRVVASCWLQESGELGKHLGLSTASVSVLGFEHDNHVIQSWNQTSHLEAE